MFRVLVLGGIALVGGSACGGDAAVQADAGVDDGGFPSETNASSEAGLGFGIDDGFPNEGVVQVDAQGFPSELPNLPPYRDAGPEVGPDATDVSDAASEATPDAAIASDAAPEARSDAGDASTDGGCFPCELPQ